jgi:hypothetical protein
MTTGYLGGRRQKYLGQIDQNPHRHFQSKDNDCVPMWSHRNRMCGCVSSFDNSAHSGHEMASAQELKELRLLVEDACDAKRADRSRHL